MIKTSLKTPPPPPPNSKQKSPFDSVSIHDPSIHSQITRRISFISRSNISCPKQFSINSPLLHGVENRGINDVLSVVAPPPEFLFASLSESTRVTRQGDIVSRVIHSICVPHKSPRREKTEAKKKGLLVDIRSDQNIHFSRFNTACIRGRSLGVGGEM